jgi:hypothetical protein
LLVPSVMDAMEIPFVLGWKIPALEPENCASEPP